MEILLGNSREIQEFVYPCIEADYLGCVQGIHFIWFGYERYPKTMRGLTADTISKMEINIPNTDYDMDLLDAAEIVDGIMIACIDQLET